MTESLAEARARPHISWMMVRRLSIGLAAALSFLIAQAVAQSPRAESCVEIGGSIFCGATGSNNRVGRSVIFNQGPTGTQVGNTLYRGLRAERVLPLPPPSVLSRDAVRPGGYIDFSRGRDFGAFVFPLENKLQGRVTGARAGPRGPSLPPLSR